MSLGAQFQRINAQAATFRQDTFGTATGGVAVQIEYDLGLNTIPGYYSPVKDQVKTEEAGYIEEYDSTVRIPKATAGTFTPELHKLILLRETIGVEAKEIRLTIENIQGSHPASAEWVLGCNAAN